MNPINIILKKTLPKETTDMLREIRNQLRSHLDEINVRKKGAQHFRSLLESAEPLNIDLGSGPVPGKNGWITVDYLPGCDVRWNLLDPLPLPDNSVRRIFCAHVLEHFFYHDILSIMREAQRILIEGGEFFISVPNASIYIDAYSNPDSIKEIEDKFYKPAFLYHTPIDYLNYMAYMDGSVPGDAHRHMYDKDNLLALLDYCGFSKVTERQFDPSLDLESRNHESLYALAIK